MKRRDLDYVVITLLVGSSIYVFLTGLIADTMGLHHFGFHSQVGYLWISLAVLHLIQTWVRVQAFVRHRFRHTSAPRQNQRLNPLAAPPSSATPTIQPAVAERSERMFEKSPQALHSPPCPSKLGGAEGQSPPIFGDLGGECRAFEPFQTSPDQGARQPSSIVTSDQGKSSRRRYLLLAILAIATGIGFDHLITPSKTFEPAEGEQDLGLRYHRWSQPGYGEVIGTLLNWGQQPPRYKTYPHVPQISLPPPPLMATETAGTASTSSASRLPPDLFTVMAQRRSQRTYNTRSLLSLAHLSQLLHFAHGITWDAREFRTVPSSGALYPLEIYAIVHRVEGLDPGLYHHEIQQHQLALLNSGDLRQPLIQAGLNQDFLGEANVCFVVSGLFQRTRWKYHERTYRYVLMETGHLGQNLYLAATALGLGVCGIGAFLDDPLNQLLGLDGQQEAALYLVTVGQL